MADVKPTFFDVSALRERCQHKLQQHSMTRLHGTCYCVVCGSSWSMELFVVNTEDGESIFRSDGD